MADAVRFHYFCAQCSQPIMLSTLRQDAYCLTCKAMRGIQLQESVEVALDEPESIE